MTLPRETLDNLFHLSTRDPLFIGYALADLRQRQRIGVDEQARRLGLNVELLARLAVCRLPRPDCHGQDVDRVARFVGLTPEALETLLASAEPMLDLDALGKPWADEPR